MANRVLLGNRGGTYGLFVSQLTKDVTNASDTTTLSFDSRAVRSLMLHAKGEGSLAPNSANDDTGIDSPTVATITHGLGYKPVYVVRWCYASDLSSGVSQRMYSPSVARNDEWDFDFQDDEEESDWETTNEGGVSTAITTTQLKIYNYEFGHSIVVGNDDAGTAPSEVFGQNKQTIYYAYIIFKAKDFTGGAGL